MLKFGTCISLDGKRLRSRFAYLLAVIPIVLAIGCEVVETHQSLTPSQPVTAASLPPRAQSVITVSRFDNRSSYLRGIFSDNVDRLGSQAQTILIGHLEVTGRFRIADRANMDVIAQEAKIKEQLPNISGADYVITGDVVEFGRKEVGDQQLFGLLGQGKHQTAYAKVTLNVIDVATSEVIYSAHGAGEYTLSKREVLGFGGTASYDSTLNGKVLDLAIREAVDRLVEAYDGVLWGKAK